MDREEFKKFMEESFDKRMEMCESMKISRKYLESLPDQPERLNPEDKNWFGRKAEFREDGLCYFEDGTIIDPDQPIDVCDSPNSANK